MDSRDQGQGAVSNLVRILRRMTRIVQIAPFAYLLLLGVYLVGEPFLPGWSLRLLDNLLNAPLYVTVGLLGAGRMLKLCSWFRTACLLPFTTRVGGYVDSFVYTFTQNEVMVVNTLVGILFISFVFFSIRHFFYGRAER